MPYIIRSAEPDDLNAVAAVENACFPPEEAATCEAFAARLHTFPECFFLAQSDEQVVGIINGCRTTAPYLTDDLYKPCCPHSPSNPWQTVFGLAVLPEYQHHGIAKALISHLIDQCRREHKSGVILTCKSHRIGFYETFGFVCRGISDSSHGGSQWYDMVLSLS